MLSLDKSFPVLEELGSAGEQEFSSSSVDQFNEDFLDYSRISEEPAVSREKIKLPSQFDGLDEHTRILVENLFIKNNLPVHNN